MGEREVEVSEAERVVALRKEEIDVLKKARMELAVRDAQFDGEDRELLDMRLEQELTNLRAECEGMIEEEHAKDLDRLVQQERTRRDESGIMDVDPTHDKQAQLREKMAMARKIGQLHQERIRLVKDVVDHQSAAGLGERQADYRRLITGALGVREEDVETMLPDIVAELEDIQNAMAYEIPA